MNSETKTIKKESKKNKDFLLPGTLIKRDKSSVSFDLNKIKLAIQKAGAATGEFNSDVTGRILDLVLQRISVNFGDKETIQIEQVQDIVERVLADTGYFKTARSYIVYREKHKLLRSDTKNMLDVTSSVNDYLDRLDWRVKANANQGYSLGGLIINISGKVIANYWLNHVYSPAVGKAHREGDLHVHDLDMLAGYCAGWSLRRLLHEGLNKVEGKVDASPPKHLSSAVGQMVNFFGILQNEWAGAQAFSSFDTYLAPYIRKDKMAFKQVKQALQELIYNLNAPSRWGTQTPFTNLTFDWTCPSDLKDDHPIIAGEEQPFTYGDLQEEMDMINQIFIEIMTTGDAKGRAFTFPIPTYNMTTDFDWDSDNAERLFAMTAKYGIPYFQNFINSELSPKMIRSMCCRLQLDLRELLKRGNGLFGSAEQTGSLGVVTINCARLGYLYKNDEQTMFEHLDKLLDIAKDSLESKRKVIQRLMDSGLFPYTKRYLGTMRNHFSTIGVNGINEMIRNFTNDQHDITDEYGHDFACRVLDHVREKLVVYQEDTGHMYNLEATPAEGTTYRLAKEDKKRYPDILQAGTKEKPYYTNSSQLPVGYTDDPFLEMEMQDKLQSKYTGGTVLHFYMNERISSADACKKFIKKVLESSRIPYITITPTFSVCPKHGYLKGEHKYCPHCDSDLIERKKQPKLKEKVVLKDEERQLCEIWTRVMGYYRPTSQYNIGKQGEYEERIFCKEKNATEKNYIDSIDAPFCFKKKE